MKALLSVLLLLPLAAASQPSNTDRQADRGAVIRAVLTERAAAVPRGERTCLSPRTSAPLASVRIVLEAEAQADRLAREQSPTPASVSPVPRWYVIASVRGVRRARPLGDEQARRLDAAYDHAIHAAPDNEGMIAAGEAPAPLVLGERRDGCDGLALSEPAFEGDVAFVEVATQCGPLCGGGSIYALVRREDGWSLEARMETWVS